MLILFPSKQSHTNKLHHCCVRKLKQFQGLRSSSFSSNTSLGLGWELGFTLILGLPGFLQMHLSAFKSKSSISVSVNDRIMFLLDGEPFKLLFTKTPSELLCIFLREQLQLPSYHHKSLRLADFPSPLGVLEFHRCDLQVIVLLLD